MKPTVALIDWYGPYTLDEVGPATFDYDDGLYMVIGRKKFERNTKLQYIGLAKSLAQRLNKAHHKLGDVKNDVTIWLGEVASPRTPGNKIKVTDRMLDLTEWAHIYYLNLPLNQKKKANPPDKPIIVYNRWWKKDYATRLERRPHADWPDLIDYSDGDSDTRVVWFGGKQKKIP